MLAGPVSTAAANAAAQCEVAAASVGVMGLQSGLSLEAAGGLVNALTVVSVLATTAFALMGFFTSNKDTQGRLTRAGRIAVCGVLLTALLSIASRSVEGKIGGRGALRPTKSKPAGKTPPPRNSRNRSAVCRP
jgi:hypothetical protein